MSNVVELKKRNNEDKTQYAFCTIGWEPWNQDEDDDSVNFVSGAFIDPDFTGRPLVEITFAYKAPKEAVLNCLKDMVRAIENSCDCVWEHALAHALEDGE